MITRTVTLPLTCLLAVSLTLPLKQSANLAYWTPGAERGLRLLSGADGLAEQVVRGGSPCVTTKPGLAPDSLYLYFEMDSAPGTAPVYVVVEYFDDALGPALQLQYDSSVGSGTPSHYHPAEEQAGGWRYGTGRWRRAVFRLARPRFRHGQNLGADFRLCGAGICVRMVTVTASRPADWDAIDRVGVVDVKPLVRIGAGEQLIVGGFDPARASDAGPQSHALEAAIPAMQSLGVTSHEGYVRWNLCEPREGQFDWSVYDRFVAVYRRHHLKWVPFLICGSAYSLPDWYYKKPGSQGYVCLEHHLESDVQSLWNPVLARHVERFIRAFCAHYGRTGVIESILLGVTGNYGEAIYPASGNDWTADIHGPYHSHFGFWAGDPFAVKSFRAWVQRRYATTDRLRMAWGSTAPEIADVAPFLRANAPNDRAWLDMCEWYIGSMTQWARFWLRTTRSAFPKGDIYLCTGGESQPPLGSDFGDQCRAAAEVGAGVRITNEASDYRLNFSLTRWVASAARQYGGYFSYEPAGGVDASGVVNRLYNAAASGARGLHYYYNNLFDTPAAGANFARFGAELCKRSPLVEIAVYYPETQVRLTGQGVLAQLRPLRDHFDFDYMSDGQIADGGLKRVKVLVLVSGSTAEERTWQAILQWVRGGGLLLSWDGPGPLRTVDDAGPWEAVLLGPGAQRGRGRVLRFPSTDLAGYIAFLSETLSSALELSPLTRAMVSAGRAGGGLFATAFAPNELLWLNTTNHPVQRGDVTVPAHGIASERVKLPGDVLLVGGVNAPAPNSGCGDL